MIKISYYLCFSLVLALSACQQKNESDKDTAVDINEQGHNSPKNSYTNPVLDKNFPDPTVIEAADGYYYAYATNASINGKVINIQVSRSKDLVNWDKIKDALPEKPSWAEKDIWAPHVLYDADKQMYYLYYSAESSSNRYGKCMGVATSKSPAGPFEDKGTPLLCGDGFEHIDPMAFDDSKTGKKLLYWGSGFQAIKVQELTEDRMDFKADSSPIELIHPIADEDPDNYQRLVEGAWVERHNNYYYLYYSGDNCCGDNAHYAVMVARSKSATGPFVSYAQLTQSENSVILKGNQKWIAPGHNSIVTDRANQDWIVYHAIDSSNRSKGRVMLVDKLFYKDGWPKIETGTPSLKLKSMPIVE